MTSQEITDQILELSNWPDFRGYGPIPGIAVAEFEVRTPELVGSRIRVHNTDGSQHIEEIVEWSPNSFIALRMHEFSAPLSKLATHIDELWEFESTNCGTDVVRAFKMHPRSVFTLPFVWLISKVLRRAVDKHLHQLGR